MLPDVDAVELKLTVPDTDQPPVLGALGIDPLDAESARSRSSTPPTCGSPRPAWWSAPGVRSASPATRPSSCGRCCPRDVPAGLRELPGFKVEVDASPAGFICSCSLTAEVADRKVKALFAGDRRSADRAGRAAAGAADGSAPRGRRLSATCGCSARCTCSSASSRQRASRGRMVAELWFLPGRLAASSSCRRRPSRREAFQAAAETKVFLAGHGVDLDRPAGGEDPDRARRTRGGRSTRSER